MANLSFSVAINLLTENFKKGASTIQQSLKAMQMRVLTFVAAISGVGLSLGSFISQLISTARETSKVTTALKNVSGSTANYVTNQKFLLELSKKYGVEVLALTDNYAKFTAAASNAGVRLADQKKIFDSVSRACIAFGMSADDTNLSFLAITQMMSKGKISSEELRRQLGERMPIAMIILPEIPLSGELKFKMFAIDTLTFSQITGYYIKGLKVSYKKLDSLEDKTSEKSDRIYSNVVNSSFVNELDEIEFKMSSWNNDDVCFAKVLLGSGFLKDNLYCSIYNSLVRPEENLIRRIIDQYSATKIKLNQVLIYSPLITPVSLLSDNYMTNKRFINTGGEIDFEADRFEVKMIEA